MADQEIRIVPGNPADFSPGDLEDLATALRGEFPDSSVVIVAQPMTGYGVTFWEVLNIFVSWPSVPHDVLVAGVSVVAARALGMARRRLKKSPLRPKYVGIYGPDGGILKAVRVEASGEEIDMTEEQRAQAARTKEIMES